ncbi:hypothetical protein, partial [Thermogemmatispora sp.]
TFNAIAIAQGSEADRLAAGLSSLPGWQKSVRRLDRRVIPLSIDGIPLQQLIPANAALKGRSIPARAMIACLLSCLSPRKGGHQCAPLCLGGDVAG